jgi:hypothetical protein
MSQVNYVTCSDAVANDPILAPRKQFIAVKEEFDPSNFNHRQSLLKWIETGIWNKTIVVYGSFNVPFDCMRKMAYYACKFDATQ